MKVNRTFCEECRNDVEYTVTTVPMTGSLKGKEYHYIGKEAHCIDCGSLIYVHELNDYNLRALYDVYRSANGIIALDTVLDIPKKYNIGKRPLSLILGWGEQTFSRYCEGDIPTKQYSEILLRIYNEPKFYLKLLEANKNNLKSDISYKKSHQAVDILLGKSITCKSKINLVVEYLLNQCEDITPLALQKALYYIQGFYYAFYNTFLFSEDCQAWAHGPVYPTIYFRYKNYHYDPIEKIDDFDISMFSANEMAIYNSIIDNFCCYSGKILEHFTHSELPWIVTRGNLEISVPSTKVIEKVFIGDYFSTIKNQYKMINPKDIGVYSNFMFSNCRGCNIHTKNINDG